MSNDSLPSLERLAELQQLIADFARVLRVPQLADTGRPENDVEHSFGLALTCWFLAPKIAPELNLEKILQYALAHDVVELHAGDTYAFSEQAVLEAKPKREDAAIERLQEEWPDFPELVDFTAGYKDKRDEEAKFVYAVDKLLPNLHIHLGEKATFWHRHKITEEMERKKKSQIRTSPYVEPYYEKLMEWSRQNGYFYTPATAAEKTRET